MSGGKLVKILLKTRVSRYLEWKSNKVLMQASTELMSSKPKKKGSSAKEESRSRKFQPPTPKH